MKNIWFKYKFPIIIIGYALVVFLGVYFLIVPTVRDIKSRAYEIQAKAVDREIEKTQIDKLPEIKKEWTDYESRQDSLKVILGQTDQVAFIENIEAIAEKSGDKIDLKIEDDNNKKAFETSHKKILSEISDTDYFPIQINLIGDYAGLVNFMHLLENSQFYVNVIAISSVKNAIDNVTNQNPFVSSTPSGNVNDQLGNNDTIKTEITAIVYTQKQ